MKVEVANLRKHFGRTKAVDGISFAFESGNVFGFVGPNGAGKTTTLRILATLDEPTAGDIFIDDVSIRQDPEAIRRLMGFVPDTLPSHSDITVHEYLDFFARAHGLVGSQRRSAVEAIEEFTNVAGIKEKLLKSLSKGMKQRVSLGRALVHDPAILVLDEPAAGLDPRARVEFRELISALAEQGKAILISSHILTELSEICNGVVIIERGQILETGTISEVGTNGLAHSRSVAVRPLERIEELHKELLQMSHIESVRREGAELHVDIDGSEEDVSDVMAELFQKGYRIGEFRQLQDDLEDIFMRVTKGGVQ